MAAVLLRSPAPAPPALVLGVPLGTLLGRAIGWQGAFGLMTLMALMLVVWIIAIVPDFPAAKAHRPSLSGVFLQCGIRAVLFVVFTFIVAHNILYIYRSLSSRRRGYPSGSISCCLSSGWARLPDWASPGCWSIDESNLLR
ncbi:hypothetical protein M5585_21895 [Serratia ureilytica]